METNIKVFRWMPRIICILAILFISLFALDSFDTNLTIWQQLGGFLIHLIPTYILTAALFVSWKWEYTGGIIFLIIGLALSPFIFKLNYHRTNSVGVGLETVLLVTFPFIVVGILFIISAIMKKKESSKKTITNNNM